MKDDLIDQLVARIADLEAENEQLRRDLVVAFERIKICSELLGKRAESQCS